MPASQTSKLEIFFPQRFPSGSSLQCKGDKIEDCSCDVGDKICCRLELRLNSSWFPGWRSDNLRLELYACTEDGKEPTLLGSWKLAGGFKETKVIFLLRTQVEREVVADFLALAIADGKLASVLLESETKGCIFVRSGSSGDKTAWPSSLLEVIGKEKTQQLLGDTFTADSSDSRRCRTLLSRYEKTIGRLPESIVSAIVLHSCRDVIIMLEQEDRMNDAMTQNLYMGIPRPAWTILNAPTRVSLSLPLKGTRDSLLENRHGDAHYNEALLLSMVDAMRLVVAASAFRRSTNPLSSRRLVARDPWESALFLVCRQDQDSQWHGNQMDIGDEVHDVFATIREHCDQHVGKEFAVIVSSIATSDNSFLLELGVTRAVAKLEGVLFSRDGVCDLYIQALSRKGRSIAGDELGIAHMEEQLQIDFCAAMLRAINSRQFLCDKKSSVMLVQALTVATQEAGQDDSPAQRLAIPMQQAGYMHKEVVVGIVKRLLLEDSRLFLEEVCIWGEHSRKAETIPFHVASEVAVDWLSKSGFASLVSSVAALEGVGSTHRVCTPFEAEVFSNVHEWCLNLDPQASKEFRFLQDVQSVFCVSEIVLGACMEPRTNKLDAVIQGLKANGKQMSTWHWDLLLSTSHAGQQQSLESVYRHSTLLQFHVQRRVGLLELEDAIKACREEANRLMNVEALSTSFKEWLVGFYSSDYQRYIEELERATNASCSTVLPECLSLPDKRFSDSLSVFKNEGWSSIFFDMMCLEHLWDDAHKQTQKRDPFELVIVSKQQSKKFVSEILDGKLKYDKVKPLITSEYRKSIQNEYAKQKRALEDLLEMEQERRDNRIDVLFQLLSVEPNLIPSRALKLRVFVEKLNLEAPKALVSFLDKHVHRAAPEVEVVEGTASAQDTVRDFSSLTLFPASHNQSRLVDEVTSLDVVLSAFKDVLPNVEPKDWVNIESLERLVPIAFRITNEQFSSEESLNRALDKLRSLCVTHRDIELQVLVLDSLAPLVRAVVHESANEGCTDSVSNLLKSQAFKDAVHNKVELVKLADLFGMTEGSLSDTKKLVAIVRDSTLKLSVAHLKKEANNLRYDGDGVEFVSCEPMEMDGILRVFAEGEAVKGKQLQALLVELRIQLEMERLQVPGKQANRNLDDLDEVDERVSKAHKLSNDILDAVRMGFTEFSELYENAEIKENSKEELAFTVKVDKLDLSLDTMECVSEYVTGRKRFLIERAQAAREEFPWITYSSPVYTGKESKRGTLWMRSLARIAASTRGSLHAREIPSQDPNDISRWIRGLMSNSLPASATLAKNPEQEKSLDPGRSPVLVLSCKDENVAQCALGFLSKYGPFPPPATAIFPCDLSTKADAVLDLCFRLECATQVLSMHDSSKGDKLRHIFLCEAMALARPDILPIPLQQKLLDSLSCYLNACLQNPGVWCPCVAIILHQNSVESSTPDRMTDVFSYAPEFEMFQVDDAPFVKCCASLECKGVTIIQSDPRAVAVGLRSFEIMSEETYVVRAVAEMRVMDLLLDLRQSQRDENQRPICIDFGIVEDSRIDEGSKISGSFALSLCSLILCGVVGQAQHDPVVLGTPAPQMLSQREIFLHCSSTTLLKQLPFLSFVSSNCFKVSKAFDEVEVASDFSQPFDDLQQSLVDASVGDELVVKALKKVFEASDSAKERTLKPEQIIPFVHNSESLKIMGIVANRVRLLDSMSQGSPKVPSELPLPVLLSGDTGTGKTYLLNKFFELLFRSGVIANMKNRRLTCSLSAAFTSKNDITTIIKEMLSSMIRASTQSEKTIWDVLEKMKGATQNSAYFFILDEITASPAQEALSRLLVYREVVDGRPKYVSLAKCGVLITATCNPKVVRDSVFSMTGECRRAQIEVQSLPYDKLEIFVAAQLRRLRPNWPDRDIRVALRLCLAARKIAEKSSATGPMLGTFSLRDASRCVALAGHLCSVEIADGSRESFFDLVPLPEGESWLIESVPLRCTVIACYLCFGMRVLPREEFYKPFNEAFNTDTSPAVKLDAFLKQVKVAVLHAVASAPSAVETPALLDNVLALVVASYTRMPLLCLGDDGTSKTLCLSMVFAQMQGEFSSSNLLQRIGKVQPFHLQLSEKVTASHIRSLDDAVKGWVKRQREFRGMSAAKALPCVVMEEMSMAKEGPEGPLRALHRLLDSHQEMASDGKDGCTRAEMISNMNSGSNQFGFFATSNFLPRSRELPVGRALGNRLLVLAHDKLDAQSLIQLAYNVGINAFGATTPDGAAQSSRNADILKRCLEKLCMFKPSPDEEPIVPSRISVRSLLFFSRTLFAALSAMETPCQEDAEKMSFAAHLQLLGRQQTRSLYSDVERALGWTGQWVPMVDHALHVLGGPGGSRRPLLLLYDSPNEIEWLTDLVEQKFGGKDEEHLKENKKSVYICPGSGLQNENSEESGEVVRAMVKLRAAVERGILIFILNPEPILQGIHALLNDCDKPRSTIQIKTAHENVLVHKDTRIILLVARDSVHRLQRPVISRVSVVNSGFCDDEQAKRVSSGYEFEGKDRFNHHEVLLRRYKTIDMSCPVGEEEKLLLDSTDTTLLQVFERFASKHASDSTVRIKIVLIRQRMPTCLKTRPLNPLDGEPAFEVDHIALGNNSADFFRDLDDKVQSLLEDPLQEKRCMLIVDLCDASKVVVVEVLVSLRFAKGYESGSICQSRRLQQSLGERLNRLANQESKRVVLLLDSSCEIACSPGEFAVWKQRESDSEPSPYIDQFVAVEDVRCMTQSPFSGEKWPVLTIVVQNPESLFCRAVEFLMECVSRLPSCPQSCLCCHGKTVPLQDNLKALRRTAESVLCNASPGRFRTLFSRVSENASPEDQRKACRELFKSFLNSISSGSNPGARSSLSQAVIGDCRRMVFDSLQQVKRVIPLCVIRDDSKVRDLAVHILEQRLLPWQLSSDTMLRDFELCTGFPLVVRIVRLIRERINSGQQLSTPDDIRALLGGTSWKNGADLFALDVSSAQTVAKTLVEHVLRKQNLKTAGGDREGTRTAVEWLMCSAEQDTAQGRTYNFCAMLCWFQTHEKWLVVATRIKLSHPPHEPGLDETQSEMLREDFVRFALSTLLCTLRRIVGEKNSVQDGKLVPIQFCEALELNSEYARCIYNAMLHTQIDEIHEMHTQAMRLRSILHLWQIQGDVSNPEEALRIANSVVWDGGKLPDLWSSCHKDRSVLLFAALEECDTRDSKNRLPLQTIARAAMKCEEAGVNFLARAARRRGKDCGFDDLKFLLDTTSLIVKVREEDGPVPAWKVTGVMTACIRALRHSPRHFEDMKFVLQEQQEKGVDDVSVQVLTFAVAAVAVPSFMQTEDWCDAESTFLDGALVRWYMNLTVEERKKMENNQRVVFRFFNDLSNVCMLPVRRFLIRCAVARFDEGGLPTDDERMSVFFGEWVNMYIGNARGHDMQTLMTIDEFSLALGDADLQEWNSALAQAFNMEQEKANQLHAEWRDATSKPREDIRCRVSAVYVLWQAIIHSRDNNPQSVLRRNEYASADQTALGSLFLPCAPQGKIETLKEMISTFQRSNPYNDVGSILQCTPPCGAYTLNGNCGEANQIADCSNCKRPLVVPDASARHRSRFAPGVRKISLSDLQDDPRHGIAWSSEPGARLTVRKLSPLSYRLLSVLMMLPMVGNQAMRENLEIEWQQMKAVAGLNTDTDAQLWVAGVLRHSGYRLAKCVLGGDFTTKVGRDRCEQSFEQDLSSILASFLDVAGRSCLSATDTVESVGRHVAELHSKTESTTAIALLRDSNIRTRERNDPVNAAREYATQVLIVNYRSDADEKADLSGLKQEVAANLTKFPLLAYMLFDSLSHELDGREEQEGFFDASEVERLVQLPRLVAGFVAMHGVAAKHPDAADVQELMDKAQGEEKRALEGFKMAWEELRHNLQLLCGPAQTDMGDLGGQPVQDMVCKDRGEPSLRDILLRDLLGRQNKHLSLIFTQDLGSKVELWPQGGGCGDMSHVQQSLVPWREARAQIEQIFGLIGTRERTGERFESLLQAWLQSSFQGSFLAMESWPQLSPPSEPKSTWTLVPTKPAEALQRCIRKWGEQQDLVSMCVEQLDAALTMMGEGDDGTPLDELLHRWSFEAPKPLHEMIKAGRRDVDQLQGRHVPALRDMFLKLVQRCPEDGLLTQYRRPLADRLRFSDAVVKLVDAEKVYLLRKLVCFVDKMLKEGSVQDKSSHRLVDYIEWQDIGDDEENEYEEYLQALGDVTVSSLSDVVKIVRQKVAESDADQHDP